VLFRSHWWVGVVAVTGIVLAAVYVLWLYQRTMTGPPAPGDAPVKDLDRRELVAVIPLVAGLLFFGFFPMPLLDAANPTVEQLLVHVGVSDEAPSVPAASSSLGSTASIASRIARTISGKAITAAASAAPVQRKAKVKPNQSQRVAPTQPRPPTVKRSQ